MNAREMRLYQARRRGSTSYKTLAEDAAVHVAYAAEEMTIGAACACLGLDIATFRGHHAALVEAGKARWLGWRAANPPRVGPGGEVDGRPRR